MEERNKRKEAGEKRREDENESPPTRQVAVATVTPGVRATTTRLEVKRLQVNSRWR